jgi:predicted NAD-dependent protein-ADP-ribosyltransferase YbiA (DUF1768 family)
MNKKHYIKFGVEDFNSYIAVELTFNKEGSKDITIIGCLDHNNQTQSQKEDFEYNMETLTDSEELITHNFQRVEVFDQILSKSNKSIEDINLEDLVLLIKDYFELSHLDINKQNENNLMDMVLFSVEGSDTEIIIKVGYMNNDMTFDVVSYYDSLKHEYSDGFERHKKEGLEKGVLKEYKFSQASAMIPALFRVGKDIEQIEPHDLLNLVENKYQKENLINKLSEVNNPKDKKALGMQELSKAYKQANKEGLVRSVTVSSDGSISSEYNYFKGCESPFSQLHPSNYKYKEKSFTSEFQFMVYSKAKMFEDEDSAFKILDMNNSTTMFNHFREGKISVKDILSDNEMKNRWLIGQQKLIELEKEIVGFDEEKWSKKRLPILSVSSREKFNQNLDMKNKLIKSGESIIIEGDKKEKETLPNENCQVLMNVRQVLISNAKKNKPKN